MKVFHYLAVELGNESLFDNEIEHDLTNGAVYNDFDSSPMDNLLSYKEIQSFSFSQSSTFHSSPIREEQSESLESAVDNAVIDADENTGVLYNDLHWDSEFFDNSEQI